MSEHRADDLAVRTRDPAPDAVLEVACGTGVVTRALARSLPTACTLSATDLNQAMVGHAAQIAALRARFGDGPLQGRLSAVVVTACNGPVP